MIKSNSAAPDQPSGGTARIDLRFPEATDGMALHHLVAACPPLDTNSAYCNLLQCTHFRDTSIAAERDGELVGFISGYLVPDTVVPQARALFVWQVAVSPSARKCGLASRMLHGLLERPACRDIEFLHTTVTPDNAPSRALFTAFAKSMSAPLTEDIWFERERHFGGAHDDEVLLRIGPFDRARRSGNAVSDSNTASDK